MAGMKKAARALRAAVTYQMAERLFENGDVMHGATIVGADQTPGLMLIMTRSVAERAATLRECVCYDLLLGDGVLALDAVRPDGTRLRILTEVPPRFLASVASMVARPNAEFVVILTGMSEPREAPIRRPITCRTIPVECLLREPIDVGSGPHCTTTINAWDGTVYRHWFPSAAEAQAQLERNVDADAPFAGLAAN